MTAPGTAIAGAGAHHIGHAADVEEDANDDADSDRHRHQSSNCVSLVSHSSHLLSGRNGLKAKGDFFALLVTLSEKLIYIYQY